MAFSIPWKWSCVCLQVRTAVLCPRRDLVVFQKRLRQLTGSDLVDSHSLFPLNLVAIF